MSTSMYDLSDLGGRPIVRSTGTHDLSDLGAQRVTTSVSLDQPQPSARIPKYPVPVSLNMPQDPGWTGIAVEGNVYGDAFEAPVVPPRSSDAQTVPVSLNRTAVR